ncbi:ABC transporter permease [Pseudogracilibacillus auburnensis]|uniref:ABC-type nitrate/sulfonate/bicarbonate transport system permease component n=1 Tax=Pseudogracilibacillus auburnensis TaxID=1494959 RepID=A0A2V3W846_9BACI|nr:ABC transporter permease [Pseudogracilibacillus auburnensis]MBO1001732.1 ABC transporter permease [Pseudogracilibacillus auburnensis]PXW89344.1 ABC-type nitrate/sulfonate/bicarbonate transport system permease component [Pseudogracilibacillus auburnensis]
MKKILLTSWRPAIAIALFICIWEFSTRIFQIETWILPAPTVIVMEMQEVLPAFFPHMVSTIRLVLIGFSIGTTIGIGVATLLHHYDKLRETIYPFLVLSQNIPIIVLAPLLLIWFGLGDTPKIIIIAMTSFFPITVATLSGFQQTDRELIHYMKMMGASKRQLFMKLELPHALPAVFSGIKIAATYSILTGVVAEWLGAQKGIGVFMTLASSSYRTPRVFVAIIITMLLSLSFFALILLLERMFIKWNREEIK